MRINAVVESILNMIIFSLSILILNTLQQVSIKKPCRNPARQFFEDD